MGFREAALLGFVLLFSGGNVCAALQNFSTDEPPSRTQRERVTQLPSSPQKTGRQPNQTVWRVGGGGGGGPVRPPVSYRIKSFRLRKPAVKPRFFSAQTLQNQYLTPELLEPNRAQKLRQGPNLNPTVKPKTKVLVFEQKAPVAADSVAVRCGEDKVTVKVNQNFLGNRQWIHPSDLTLGGCVALDTADHFLWFQSTLQGCNSTTRMTEKALLYTFSLKYSPKPIGNTFILKTNHAEVVIECHYKRIHSVSSNAVMPTWTTFASDMLTEQQLHFSLRLMTEDWLSQRPSSVYFLNDVMHIEASVLRGHHVPVRVYVDSCVATASPNAKSQPRYPFITNHGCLNDAKLTGAKSYFMQRSQEDKLQFKLKAFRFHQDHRNALYITCNLKATTLSVPFNSRHKVCSFLSEANRWVASGGDNEVCSCCDATCSDRRPKRSLGADADVQWEGTAALDPILLEENFLRPELMELPEFPSEPCSLLHTFNVTQAASYPSVALLCGGGAALALVLLVFMGAAICSRLYKATGHSVCS